MEIWLILFVLLSAGVPCLLFPAYVQRFLTLNILRHRTIAEVTEPYSVSRFVVRLLGGTLLLLVFLGAFSAWGAFHVA